MLLPNGEEKEAQSQVKLLGIILDEQLTFRNHIDKALKKANSAFGIIARLGGVKQGMSGVAVRSLFMACVRPIFEYEIEVWNFAIQGKDKDEVQKYSRKLSEESTGLHQN